MDEMPVRRFAAKQKGDLGLKLEMEQESIEIVAPVRSRARLVFENGITNEGCIRWYRNDALPGGLKAFIMHDSFVLWLLGIVPELFSEVILFHGTIFDYSFVGRFRPQIVLTVQAERFFVRAPETGVDMMRFVAQQEREKNGKQHFLDSFESLSSVRDEFPANRAA